MTSFLRNPIAIIIAVILLLIVVGSTVIVVPETKQAVITRFGEPQRVLNRYQQGSQFGDYGAGLALRIPFVEQVEWVDKRVLSIDMENQSVLSTDQRRLQVDAFARFRIVDPLRMYIAARSEQRVIDALKPILASSVRNELGRREFAALLSPERGQMMENITVALNRVAAQYGAEIVDVRIKRADLPNGAPLDQTFERMRSARAQEAQSITAEGQKQAQIIRAEAEAEAAATYSRAYNQDPDFYDFYRAMQSYRQSFISQQGGSTSIVMSPDNDYLRQFRSGGRSGGR